MRTTILLCSLISLAGCHDDDKRLASLETNTSDLTAIRAELAQLRQQVGDVAAQQQPDLHRHHLPRCRGLLQAFRHRYQGRGLERFPGILD